LEYVSLLPPEIKARKMAREKQRKLFILFILLLLVILIVYIFFQVSAFMIRQDIQAIRSEREAVEREAAALEEYEELYLELTARENVIGSAMGTVPSWSGLLRDISGTLPVGSWLSELSMSYGDESGSMIIRGWAYNHSGVASMLERMVTLDQLEEVEISASSETEYQGIEVVQFQADGVLLTGPEFFPDNRGGE
jgi:Tfp pilus assembly protein PilN